MTKPKWIQNEAQIFATDFGSELHVSFEALESPPAANLQGNIKVQITGTTAISLLNCAAMVSDMQNAIGEIYAEAWKNQGRT